MVTTKKIFCILLLIILLIANIVNIQVCYADSTDGTYLYNVNYSNVSKLNSKYSVYDLEGIDTTLSTIKQNMLVGNNTSFFSRYNSGLVHIYFYSYFMMRPQYRLTGSYVSGSYKMANANSHWVFDTDFNTKYTILNPSINYSVSYQNDGSDGVDLYYQYFEFTLRIEFDTYLKDLLLTGDLDTSYLRIQCLDSNLGWALFNNNNQPVGYKVGEYMRLATTATFGYQLENPVKNVNTGAFGFDFYQYDSWTGESGFNSYSQYYANKFNNIIESGNSRSYLCSMINYNIDSASLVKSMNSYSYISSDWAYVNDNWQQLYNDSLNDSGFTFNNTRFDLRLDIQPPIFTTDSQPVVNPYTDNQTHINLSYYDAKWYEIHLQLANAFIFMITEFPLISDITNLIYSLFIMIKASFDVLLEFNGFGILFAFGMFAIVFAFIYKLIVGD